MNNFVCYGCPAWHFVNPLELARHIVKHNDSWHLPYRAWALLTIKQGKPAVGLLIGDNRYMDTRP